MRILVVEDEAGLSRQLAHAVSGAGYAVDRAADGEQADFLVRTETYDAIILDLGLPRVDGLTLLRSWRDATLTVPVLVLTARGSWHERVQGIDEGADDYVTKPFQMEEVLARLRGLIRRANGQQEIGVRMALGAGRGAIFRDVVLYGLTIAVTGVVIGEVVAIPTTGALASVQTGSRPGTPSTHVAGAVIWVAVALLACYVPASRASRVDPMEALRHE